jgi:hypothetical protein
MYCTSTSPAAASCFSSRPAMLSFLCLVLIFIFTHSSAPAQDTSCGLVWGPIIELTPDTLYFWRPRIVAQGDTLHVICGVFNENVKLPYWRSVNGGNSFEPMKDFLSDTSFPHPAAYFEIQTNKKMLYVFFNKSTSESTPIYQLKSSDRGTLWSFPTPIPHTDSTPGITGSAIWGDTISIEYAKLNEQEAKLILSTDGGNNWFRPLLYRLGASHNSLAMTPHYLHRLHELNYFGTVAIFNSRSTNLGNTWLDTVLVSTSIGNWSDLPSLVSTKMNNDSVALIGDWRDTRNECIGSTACDIYSRASYDEGNYWEDEVRLTDEPNGNNNMARLVAGYGKIGIAFSKQIGWWDVNIYLRYSLDFGFSWSTLCVASGLPDARMGAPFCAISPTAFHVVWVMNRNDGSQGIFYRRGAIVTGVKENEIEELPVSITLEQNYPNPFNPQTAIGFSLLAVGNVTLKIYNIYGQEVATLVNKQMEAGKHTVEWNAEKFPSGMYFYRLSVPDAKGKVFSQTKKMILMK